MEFNIHACNAVIQTMCVSMQRICEIETKGAFELKREKKLEKKRKTTVHNMQCITHAVL